MEPSLLCDAYFRAIFGAIFAKQRIEFTFARNRFAHTTPLFSAIPQPWAIISAANPMSRPLPAHENLARHAELLAALKSAGLNSAPAWGRDTSGDWHEESCLIWGCSQETAWRLSRVFNQRACIWSNAGQTGLLHRPSGVWTIRTTVQVSI